MELFINLRNASAQSCPLDRLNEDGKASGLRVYTDAPNSVHVQVRVRKSATLSYSGCSLDRAQAKLVIEQLQKFVEGGK